MKKILVFIIALGLSLSVFFFVSETLMAFEWLERGITVKSQDTTAEGTRIFLEDTSQKSFVVVTDNALLTDPVKESILALFSQISGTYNLPTSNIEFKIKPTGFQTTLILQNTGQVFGFTYYNLTPPESLVPTASAILNEFNAWKDFKIKTIHLNFKENSFQIVTAPETEYPFIDIQVMASQPQKLLVSDLAVLFNEYSGWKNINLKQIAFTIDSNSIKTILTSRDDKKTIDFTLSGTKPDPKNMAKVSSFYNEIALWKNIDYKKILLTAEGSNINSVIAATKVNYNGVDMAKNIPSGMSFRYDKQIQYDFRVVTKDYFVRVRNQYSNEDKLLWQLNEAVKDPILYIQIYDPEFFYRQIEGIRNRQVEVFDGLNADLSKAYNELLAKHEKLTNSYENLKKAHEAFIYGYMTLENAGFMSTEPINKKAVARIIELKAENAELTSGQIAEQLEKEQLEAPSKVIHLVLSLYFNDFKE
ncbi:hypothetical protein KJ966_27045 [bacterium]|nr:hypothetical protein [bacterium]